MTWLENEIQGYAELAQRLASEEMHAAFQRAASIVVATLEAGNTVYTFGNGGSAAQGQHLAEELSGRYRGDRPALAGISLNACAPTLTCIANDYGYDAIFSRQLEALARRGDLVVAFSTSGKSPNILRGLETARKLGLQTLGLLGKGGGPALELTDHAIVIPSDNTARIQEAHTLALHLLCEAAEIRFGEADD